MMTAFFAMGGYAAFVWPSYGISFAVLAGAAAISLAARRSARAQVAALEADDKIPSGKAG